MNALGGMSVEVGNQRQAGVVSIGVAPDVQVHPETERRGASRWRLVVNVNTLRPSRQPGNFKQASRHAVESAYRGHPDNKLWPGTYAANATGGIGEVVA